MSYNRNKKILSGDWLHKLHHSSAVKGHRLFRVSAVEDRDTYTSYNEYYSFWRAVDATSQGISNHCIELFCLE